MPVFSKVFFYLEVVHVHHPRVKVVDLGLLTPTFGSSWWLLTTLWRKLLLVLMALMLLLMVVICC